MAQHKAIGKLQLKCQGRAERGAVGRQPADVVQRAGIQHDRCVICACRALPCGSMRLHKGAMQPLPLCMRMRDCSHDILCSCRMW